MTKEDKYVYSFICLPAKGSPKGQAVNVLDLSISSLYGNFLHCSL